MEPVEDEEWELHGPHEHMNYRVLVGFAFDPEHEARPAMCVVLYPWGVYQIEDEAHWHNTDAAQRIPVAEPKLVRGARAEVPAGVGRRGGINQP